jgi:glycosyltransferase involved in cell wall biosynthesis
MDCKIGSFAVLISVYFKESAVNLEHALESVINQTLVPEQIVLVKDGHLSAELNQMIELFSTRFPQVFKIVELQTNVGLGIALKIGILACEHDIIARMDSDDICCSDRFEIQHKYMLEHPNVSALGGVIEEFNIIPGDLRRFRRPPSDPMEIRRFAKRRNPLNHPTVMFRKSDILKVGSYEDFPLFEDYFLWIKLLQNGYIICNLDKILLHFRIGNDMIGRRHGIAYLKKEFLFLSAIKNLNFLKLNEFLFQVLLKLPIRLLPKRLLQYIYQIILR